MRLVLSINHRFRTRNISISEQALCPLDNMCYENMIVLVEVAESISLKTTRKGGTTRSFGFEIKSSTVDDGGEVDRKAQVVS